MVMRIERLLPGELEGRVDPRTYGFDVIDDELPSEEEQRRRVANLYELSKEISGIMSPRYEQLVDSVRDEAPGDDPAEDPIEEAR